MPQLGSLTLTGRTNEYEQVSTWHFKPDEDYPYEAGMMLHMVAPGIGPDGPLNGENVRHLSFASAPKEGNVFSFAMDVSSGTPFKQKMDKMQPGDKCHFFKIKFKHFAPAWTPERRDVVFIAGGVGITPIRSLILEHGDVIDWRLIHVARDNQHLFAKEMTDLGAPVDLTDHAGVASVLSEVIAQKPGAWFYICGSDRFMIGMSEMLSAAKVPEEQIRAESFK